jgi:hypothetical protein
MQSGPLKLRSVGRGHFSIAYVHLFNASHPTPIESKRVGFKKNIGMALASF